MTAWLVTDNLPTMATASPRMSAADRRALITRIAMKEFAGAGFHGTATELIANGAGVSQPYLFRLFSSKQKLFIAAAEAYFKQIENAFAEVAGSHDGPDLLDALGRRYRELLSDPDSLRLQLHIWAAACENTDIQKVARRAFIRLWRLVRDVSGADPEDVASFISAGTLLNVLAATSIPRGEGPLAEAVDKYVMEN